jgi:hypothetical protein
MAIQIEMIYERDIYNEPACLEYSWVPQGKRLNILLAPGQQQGNRVDPISAELKPSHVQVYVLTNDVHSTEGWQFPPGPPQATPVVSARIQVFEQKMEVLGTVYFADGSTLSQTHTLQKATRKCPSGL